MTTLYDVPAEDLIEAAAVGVSLTRTKSKPPDWAEFTKTGNSRELPPNRTTSGSAAPPASCARSPSTVPSASTALRTEYGDAKGGSNRYQVRPRRRLRPPETSSAPRSSSSKKSATSRAAGGEGRRISAEGTAFLDELAGDVLRDLDRRTSSATP